MWLELNLEGQVVQSYVLQVHQRPYKDYSCPIRHFSNHDLLSELMSALLSHRTKNAASHQAFQQLRAALATGKQCEMRLWRPQKRRSPHAAGPSKKRLGYSRYSAP